MSTLFAVIRSHADSVLPLRIFFSVCLVAVILAGVYVFKNRKKLFSRDPDVTGDHYGARNLRLWQVSLVWILAVDLLVTMLWRLQGSASILLARVDILSTSSNFFYVE